MTYEDFEAAVRKLANESGLSATDLGDVLNQLGEDFYDKAWDEEDAKEDHGGE